MAGLLTNAEPTSRAGGSRDGKKHRYAQKDAAILPKIGLSAEEIEAYSKVDPWERPTPVLDPEDHIKDLYEMYLLAVQRNASSTQIAPKTGTLKRYGRSTTFESFLGDCLVANGLEIEEIAKDYREGKIGLKEKFHFSNIREMGMAAVRKYLEKSAAKRLTGV